MSNAWGSDGYQQQQPTYNPPPGGVKLFNPNQFQAQAPPQDVPPFGDPSTSNANPPAFSAAGGQQGAWNSYPGWPPQAAADTMDGSSVDGSQQQVNGGQEVQGQYSTAWNQSWDGAGVYAQGGYAQPNPQPEAPGGYPQAGQQFEAASGSYAQPNQQGDSSGQFFDGYGQQFSQHSPPAPQNYSFSQSPQHESSPQREQPSYHQQTPPREEQQYNQQSPPQQAYEGQGYEQQVQYQSPQQDQPVQQNSTPQSSDQAQAYAQDPQGYYDQGQEQYQGQAHAFYDQPFDANSWTPSSQASADWGQSFQPQPVFEGDPSQGLQPNPQSGEVKDAIPPPDFSQHPGNDDDGTVSGFFNRGDDDGDVQSDSHKPLRHDHTPSRPVNQLPADGEFARAEPNEASLDLSREDDEGKAPLNDLQNLVQQMEDVHLSQQQLADANQVPVSAAQAAPEHHETYASPGHVGQSPQAGSYAEFSGPQTLPLDTSGRSSPTDRDQPESAGSGGSGASVGADWEIVPSAHAMTNSHNSLDNVGFYPDKPDGGVSVDRVGDGDSSVRQSDQGAEVPSVSVPPVCVPPPHHIGAEYSRPPTSAPLNTSHTQPPPSVSEPPVSAPPPVANLPPSGDSPGNPYRRSGTSPRQPASMPPSTHSQPNQHPPSSLTPSGIFQPTSSAFNSVTRDSEPQRAKPGSTPVKAKEATSTEDGSGPSKRDDSDATRSQPQAPSRHKNEDPSPRQRSSNSRESEQSSEQPRHSAFQPVGRTSRAAPSPAAALWDNPTEPAAAPPASAPANNILLAPAVPLIIPSMNSYTSSPKDKDRDRAEKSAREPERKTENRRNSHEHNRSFDSLDEIDRDYRDPRDRSYRNEPRSDARDSRYTRDTYRGDRSHSRAQYSYDRPMSRADRPMSRAGEYMRDDSYRRHRGYYRDYDRDYYEDRYERPRSRQDETRNGSRPSSRSGQEAERPKSRTDYDRGDRGERDYPRDRQKDHLTEERERYLRYYQEKEARYRQRGYYEDYYGSARHAADYHYQQQLYQSQLHPPRGPSRHSSQSIEGPHSRNQSRCHSRNHSQGNTPSQSRNHSRGNTPNPEPHNGCRTRKSRRELFNVDYYGRDSRAPSRADYTRSDYYNRQGYGQEYADYYARQGYGYDPYAHQEGYGYDPYNYGYGYPQQGYDSVNQSQAQAYDAGRLTPPKYSYPHVRACFGPGGQLVKVLANRPADGQPAVVEIQDVQRVLETCPEAEILQAFPGPLTRSSSHKKDVLMFCGSRVRSCQDHINMVDRESAGLIWRLLELLIKQNGSVVGTDLSDLLLEGHDPAEQPYAIGSAWASQTPELDVGARDSPSVRVTSDRTLITAGEQREESTDRFRHLLTYGRKKDALECAMKNNLWGHALFLASKMDNRTHASVMTRFANSAMRMNDPLQTLYQLMSGRQPAAVTCIVDERWGDWRPHLAMILSNQTARYELDRKSICTLGDTLATKGCLHASHFCYLMAQVNFGNFFKKTSKIVLIGSNHNLSMEEFASDEAIQCTEVYEYANTLGNPTFCLPHFQIFKYLYACKLADYGMAAEALLYCEVIANTIQQHPTWFQPSFVRLVYQLSSKLKFSDPQRLQTSEDAEDPQWMQQLLSVTAAFDDGSIQPVSGTATPALYGTTTSSESGDHYTHQPDPSQPVNNEGNLYSQQGFDQSSLDAGQFPQHHFNQQTRSDQQSTYDQQQPAYDPAQPPYDPNQQQSFDQQQAQHQQYGQQSYDTQQQSYDQQQTYDQQQQQSYDQQQAYDQQQQQTYDQQQYEQQQQPYDPSQYQQFGYQKQVHPDDTVHQTSTESQHHEPAQQEQHESEQTAHHRHTEHQHHRQPEQLEQKQYQQPEQRDQYPGQRYYGYGQSEDGVADGLLQGHQEGQMTQRSSLSTTEEEDETDDNVAPATSGFDYFGQVGTQKVVAPPHRFRTTSTSSVDGPPPPRKRTISNSSTGSTNMASNSSQPKTAQSSSIGANNNKDKKPNQQGGGWFGGIFSKFRGKNEMILPDDKNPAIVWDPDKKKWINADGTEDEDTAAAPPPKDTELMGKSSLPPAMSTAVSGGPPPPSTTAGGANKFSLKAKGARNQYVDVNNPKPVAVPQELFNLMPPSTTSAPSAAPQMFQPNAGNANNSSNKSDSLSVPGSETTTVTPATAVPSMPMLFNPASLTANKTQTTSKQGGGLKYGQRRAYPK